MRREEPSPRDYDDIERFLLFVEQLEESREMLLVGSIPKSRMAIVLLDNLASILLLSHARAVFAGSETFTWMDGRRFSTRERAKIEQDFSRQVTLACLDEGRPSWPWPTQILDASDASIFRIAHQYRNPIYHEDRHNPALLPVLGRLYLEATCRAFARSHPDGGSGGSNIATRTAPLERFGIDPMAAGSWQGTFWYGAVAEQLVAPLTDQLAVDLGEVRSILADDVRRRGDAGLELLGDLMRDGMSEEDLGRAVFLDEFWEEHGADEELLALEEQRNGHITRATHASPDHEQELRRQARESAAKAHEEYVARMQALQRAFKPKVSLDALARREQHAIALERHTDMPTLLQHYRDVDIQLSRIESCLDRVARSWDEHVQLEIDLSRGK